MSRWREGGREGKKEETKCRTRQGGRKAVHTLQGLGRGNLAKVLASELSAFKKLCNRVSWNFYICQMERKGWDGYSWDLRD